MSTVYRSLLMALHRYFVILCDDPSFFHSKMSVGGSSFLAAQIWVSGGGVGAL